MMHETPQLCPATDGTDMPQWLTADETAALLRVHVTTVQDMCRRGELPAMKAGKEWRISAHGLNEKATLGDVHNRLIQQTATLSADLTAARVLATLADALSRELSLRSPELAR